MALARDASAPAASQGAGTRVSATFTCPASARVVAFVSGDGDPVAGTPTFTVTGGGLTWSLLKRQNVQQGTCEIWGAYNSAGGSMAVTATISSGTWQTQLHVEVITGAESTFGGATSGASGNPGTPSTALTTTRDGSWVMAVSSDWAQRGLGTAGAAQTISNEYDSAGFVTCHAWRQTLTTALSGTSVTMNLTLPLNQDYNVAAVEIRESVGGAAPHFSDHPRRVYAPMLAQ